MTKNIGKLLFTQTILWYASSLCVYYLPTQLTLAEYEKAGRFIMWSLVNYLGSMFNICSIIYK